MGYLKVNEIDSALDALAANAKYSGYATVFNLNHDTADKNKKVKCLKIGKGSIPVIIVGGLHANEWAPPDSLVSLAEKLLKCYEGKKPFIDKRFKVINPDGDHNDGSYTGNITFNKAVFPKNDIQRIINKLEIYIVPCVNRDGREYTMHPAGDKTWRPNRKAFAASCATGPAPVGVDINRNFSVAWKMKEYYNTATLTNVMNYTSDDYCDANVANRAKYQGLSALSEPEARNIKELIDDKKPRFFIDVHAHGRLILHPWGINQNQTADGYKTFLNKKWDNIPANPAAQRGRPEGGTYQEYFPIKSTYDLLGKHITYGNRMRNAVLKAARSDPHAKKRSKYKVKQSLLLYPAPGASDDYALSTQLEPDLIAHPTKGYKANIINSRFPVHAFTIESGYYSDGFYQPKQATQKRQFRKVQREIHFAILGLLSSAAAWGTP